MTPLIEILLPINGCEARDDMHWGMGVGPGGGSGAGRTTIVRTTEQQNDSVSEDIRVSKQRRSMWTDLMYEMGLHGDAHHKSYC